MPVIGSSDDPLTRAMQPPSDETPEQRQERMVNEKESQRISDEIDAQLKQEGKVRAKRKEEVVRVLLLGQSESGKSTTLKNFQMVWAPQAWIEERGSWRSVVLLNIIKSAYYMVSVLLTPSSPSDAFPVDEFEINLETLFNDLVRAEGILKHQLCGNAEEMADYRNGNGALPAGEELFMPSNISWKDRLNGFRGRKSSNGVRPSFDSTGTSSLKREQEEAMSLLVHHKLDIIRLWRSPIVQELLHRRGLRLEHSPGFFLDDVDRILSPTYEPSDDDIVRARLRTMGIQEHVFKFETGTEVGQEWVIYDVGGSRPQVSSWFSYFDDVNAIIFLVPVNCFDEVLEEDEGVNRLQDSINLWKEICRSKLLEKTQLVLFLNKVDLLKRKLDAGIQFSAFVPSYGDRPNEANSVCRFLRTQFKEVLQRYSPEQRQFNAWLTCATDIKATEKTLAVVRHGIVQEMLKKANLL